MPDVRNAPNRHLPVTGALILALLFTSALMGGCKGGGGGNDSSSTSQAAPLVAAQREGNAVSSFRKAFGNTPVATENTTNDELSGEETVLSEGNRSGAGSETTERPTLTWTAPLTRENGQSLYMSDIQGYRIYYRLRHSDSVRSVSVFGADNTRLPLDNFQSGAYEFSVTVLDVDGLESQKSAPIPVDLI